LRLHDGLRALFDQLGLEEVIRVPLFELREATVHWGAVPCWLSFARASTGRLTLLVAAR
jgi:hypothetical protein